MTSSTPFRVPAREDGHPALLRLVAQPVETFAEVHWGARPLLTPAADLPRPFDDLFSAAAVDELLSTRGLRTPFLRMAKDGSTLADRSFTGGGGIGAGIADQASDEAVLRHFADGATLVLQGLHRLWAPVIEFSQQLAADLGHPVQVNAYVTPPQSTGFSDHYDVHDVFVLQVAGEKRWRIRNPVNPLPLRDEPWTDHRTAVEHAAAHTSPVIESTLVPGDCLYLPRGHLHSATALGGTSIHLTIGVHAWTRRHLAHELVTVAMARASSSADLRASLPLGTDLAGQGPRGADVELVRSALIRAIGEVDGEDLRQALSAVSRASQRPAPLAPLAQAAAVHTLGPQDTVAVRAHVEASLNQEGADGASVLRSRAGTFPVATIERPRVEALLATGVGTVDDVGADLARRLLLAGVVVPA